MSLRYLAGLVVVFGLVGFASASEDAGKSIRLSDKGISGIIIDLAGDAVAGVSVTLTSEKGAAASATTDSSGSFKLSTVAVGSYVLDIGGKIAMKAEVTSTGEQTLRVLYTAQDAQGAAPGPAPKAPAPKAPVGPAGGGLTSLSSATWVPLAVGGGIVAGGVTMGAVEVSHKGTVSP
jgi:hypothetical protein